MKLVTSLIVEDTLCPDCLGQGVFSYHKLPVPAPMAKPFNEYLAPAKVIDVDIEIDLCKQCYGTGRIVTDGNTGEDINFLLMKVEEFYQHNLVTKLITKKVDLGYKVLEDQIADGWVEPDCS